MIPVFIQNLQSHQLHSSSCLHLQKNRFISSENIYPSTDTTTYYSPLFDAIQEKYQEIIQKSNKYRKSPKEKKLKMSRGYEIGD